MGIAAYLGGAWHGPSPHKEKNIVIWLEMPSSLSLDGYFATSMLDLLSIPFTHWNVTIYCWLKSRSLSLPWIVYTKSYFRNSLSSSPLWQGSTGDSCKLPAGLATAAKRIFMHFNEKKMKSLIGLVQSAGGKWTFILHIRTFKLSIFATNVIWIVAGAEQVPKLNEWEQAVKKYGGAGRSRSGGYRLCYQDQTFQDQDLASSNKVNATTER